MTQLQINEISLNGKLDFQSLKMTLANELAMPGPHFIDLTKESQITRDEVVRKLQTAIEELKINVRFPYPCYLIVGNDIRYSHSSFPQIDNRGQLPYFFSKKQQSRKKEVSLTARITTYFEKLQGMPLDKNLKEVHAKLDQQDQLYIYCQQEAHLQRVLQKRSKRRNHGR